MNAKTIDDICVQDFMDYPVWRFPIAGEFQVEPARSLPCSKNDTWIVGTQVRLVDGDDVWAMLANLDPCHPDYQEHLLSISVEQNGKWFHLARYHDIGYHERGPLQLAEFLGKPIENVFPITYDVRAVCKSHSAALTGRVNIEPSIRLTDEEIINMVLSTL